MGKMNNKLEKTMDKTREDMWHFLYKEWSKLYDLLYAYDKIFKNIEIKDNRYNEGFQLLLDSLTRSMALNVDIFFQQGKRYWSLYTLDENGEQKEEINKIRKEAEFCIILRNENLGHLPKNVIQSGNFRFFNQAAIKKIKEIYYSINDILLAIGRAEGKNESYTEGFIGIQEGINLIMDDLNK
jgi:hypothetical protein